MTVEADEATFDQMLEAAMSEVDGADESDALDDAGDAGPDDEEDLDASGELADEADEEGVSDEEDVEEDSDEPDLEPDDDEPPAAEDSGRTEQHELDRLRAVVARQENELLGFRSNAPRPQASQPQRRVDPRLEAAVQAIYRGGDVKESLKDFDPTTQRAAIKFVQHDADQQARYGLDPELAYAEKWSPFVARHAMQLFEDRFRALEDNQRSRDVGEVVRGYDEVLRTGSDKAEVARILREEVLPNPKQTIEQRMRIAVELLVSRRDAGKLARTKQKVEARGRDQDSRRRARRESGARKKKKRGRARPPQTDDLEAYAKWAAEHEDQLGPDDFVGVE